MAALAAVPASAQSQCTITPSAPGCDPQPRFHSDLDGWQVTGEVFDLGPHEGFRTLLTGHLASPGSPPAAPTGSSTPGSTSTGRTIVARVFCSRDDYAFLPPVALAGIPCDTQTPA